MSEPTTNQLFNKMKDAWEELEQNHQDFDEKDNKAAGLRARKAANRLKKQITPYRKASVNEAKQK